MMMPTSWASLLMANSFMLAALDYPVAAVILGVLALLVEVLIDAFAVRGRR